MKLRDRWRRVRLYYRSWTLFSEKLANPYKALALPFLSFPFLNKLTFVAKNSQGFQKRFSVPGNCWYVLPNFLRLIDIGAEPSIVGDPPRKRVLLGNLVLNSPLETKEEGTFYREIFIDDVYRIRDSNLSGKVVVDIGGYIGDSALAFASKGAYVHVLEPSSYFFTFLQKNISENKFDSKIHPHAVGLSNKSEVIHCSHSGAVSDQLKLVEGIDFTLNELPQNIEYLKLDCEGCEYHLLSDNRFLRHLNPNRIAMEFHHGPQDLPDTLRNSGYEVEVISDETNIGYIYAEKRQNKG